MQLPVVRKSATRERTAITAVGLLRPFSAERRTALQQQETEATRTRELARPPFQVPVKCPRAKVLAGCRRGRLRHCSPPASRGASRRSTSLGNGSARPATLTASVPRGKGASQTSIENTEGFAGSPGLAADRCARVPAPTRSVIGSVRPSTDNTGQPAFALTTARTRGGGTSSIYAACSSASGEPLIVVN